MSISRRKFIASTIGSAAAVSLSGDDNTAAAAPVLAQSAPRPSRSSFGPWLEIDAGAIAHNIAAIAARTGNRPVLAVAKNNAYGCGLATAGPILDRVVVNVRKFLHDHDVTTWRRHRGLIQSGHENLESARGYFVRIPRSPVITRSRFQSFSRQIFQTYVCEKTRMRRPELSQGHEPFGINLARSK